MQHERGYFLDSLSSAVCWLTVCISVGYLSAQILLWHRNTGQVAQRRGTSERISCCADTPTGFDARTEFSATEGGLFDHFQWELVKT